MTDKIETQTRTDDALRQQKNMEENFSMIGTELMPLVDVANMLHLSKITVRRMVSSGFLTAYRTCRKYLFKREEILEYLENQKIGGSHTS